MQFFLILRRSNRSISTTITHLPLTKDGYRHILVIVDSFTHFTMLTATKSLGAPDVEEALQLMFGRFGG
jgi:hypothetical protein